MSIKEYLLDSGQRDGMISFLDGISIGDGVSG